MERECLVTGAAGFVGSHLAERLLSLGFAVVGIDNFFSGRTQNMASFSNHAAFTFYEADAGKPRLLEALKEKHPGLSHCFHLAAIVSVPYSLTQPEQTMRVNFEASARLVEAADRLGFDSFVFAGSAAEYGDDQPIPLREEYATDATIHLSPYGRSKFLASRWVAASTRGVALRFFNIYGPRQDPASPYSGVISRFIQMARAGKTMTIFGDGLQTRDFVYVSDVVEAYVQAGCPRDGGRVVPPGIYNIGSGTSTSILALSGTVARVFGSGAGVEHLPERQGDTRHSLAATEKFRNAADWVPRVTLEEGLRIMAEEFTGN